MYEAAAFEATKAKRKVKWRRSGDRYPAKHHRSLPGGFESERKRVKLVPGAILVRATR